MEKTANGAQGIRITYCLCDFTESARGSQSFPDLKYNYEIITYDPTE